MKYNYSLWVFGLIGLFSTFGIAQTDSIDISISLNGAQAATASAGVGSELGSGTSGCYYVNSTNTLHVKFQYSGLGSNSTAAHIHGPAAAGVNAGVVQGLTGFVTGTTSGTYSASFVLSGTNETYLLNDQLYINIHTVTFGGGEIRGQLINTNTYLPVELTSFQAMVVGRGVELVWKTATEVNNYGFDIERFEKTVRSSSDAPAWQTIGFVPGNGTTNTPQSYSFVDASPRGTVQYRLKQIDRDGSFEYTTIVEATVARIGTEYALDQNYPNPFNPATRISFQMPLSGHAAVKVYDMLGKEVATLVDGVRPAGEHTVEFNAASLPSGLYFYTLRSSGYTQTRKMLLLK